ncbi:MAG TPA: GGDEF domain-containing protein [Allosphingosinicella sp.]
MKDLAGSITLSRDRLHGEQWLDALIAWATRLSRRRAWTITLLAAAVALSTSHLIGPEVWFGPVYLLIVCLPAWSLGWRAAFVVGFACASTSIALHGLNAYPVGEVAIVWNLAMRLLAVSIIVILVRGFRRSYDREWQRARSDDLTGALSKQAFHEQVAVTRRRGEWGLLAYVDLDGFKQVNDRHGHAAGDEVLRRFARGVSEHIRPTDVFARIGGDEFLLYLSVHDEAKGRILAERLHARMNFVLTLIPHPIRCSTGVLVMEPGPYELSEAEIALADGLMYEAKQHGGAALRIATRAAALLGETRSPAPAEGEGSPRRAA